MVNYMDKTFYIESLGCAKNQVDSEVLIQRLVAAGLTATSADDAALLIVNSCGFIESAKQESINTVLTLRQAHPSAKIALVGCMATRYEAELRESLSEADIVAASFDALIAAVAPAATGAPPVGERPLLSLPGAAYLKIAEGCNNACSFCAIPLMRGPLVSRSIADVKEEFVTLLRRGVFEVCLLAQDSAAYGVDIAGQCLLPQLLEALLAVEGDYWIRLLYLHPDHFPMAILPLMQRDKRLVPYFDIPFQHASSTVLRAMGRRGDAAVYGALVDRIREALPDAVIRSTFMVGFPGEGDEEFAALLEFARQAALEWAGVFAYSREEGTPAATMKRRVSKKVASARKAALEAQQEAISARSLERFVGRRLAVLLEEAIPRDEAEDGDERLYIGRAYLHAPEVDGAVVVEAERDIAPGAVVTGDVVGVAGLDLRVRVRG
jgi:ribosomal protein S12 methylthiotransferase